MDLNNVTNMLEIYYWNQNGEVLVHLNKMFSSINLEHLPDIKQQCIDCIDKLNLQTTHDINPKSCFVELIIVVVDNGKGLEYNCTSYIPHELQ